VTLIDAVRNVSNGMPSGAMRYTVGSISLRTDSKCRSFTTPTIGPRLWGWPATWSDPHGLLRRPAPARASRSPMT
jgi:hypothetical protein